MNGIVLLIEDDKQVMEYYVRALEQKDFKVEYFSNPDAIFEFIEKEKPKVAAVILDIMMLPGERYQHKDTDGGLRTGVFLYDDFKRLYPHVPIIVLTNVSNQKVLDEFHTGPLLKVIQKLDFSPFKLAQLVSEMIQAASKDISSGEKVILPNGD